MKILFLCGSLQAGRDGVGDYTTRLCEELIRLGHQVAAVALNDHHTSSLRTCNAGAQGKFASLRIPYNWATNDRLEKAKEYIDSFDPQWISLQFVIYAFHSKGLAFGLAKNIERLSNGRPLHIMFHELWIGFSKVSPLKHKIIGHCQKLIITSITKRLQPLCITTSNILYQLLLKENHIKASVLPLFSNIPLATLDKSFVAEKLNDMSIDEKEIDSWMFTGIFGNLHPDTNLEASIQSQLSFAQSGKKKLAFLSFGRINSDSLTEFQRLEKVFVNRVKFAHFGELATEKVSSLFQILNTGISCTPSHVLGKSGAFAAMRRHDVEVILPKGPTIPEFKRQINDDNKRLIQRPASTWSAAHIAEQFVTLLRQER